MRKTLNGILKIIIVIELLGSVAYYFLGNTSNAIYTLLLAGFFFLVAKED